MPENPSKNVKSLDGGFLEKAIFMLSGWNELNNELDRESR
jgi:hypothetical protein